MGTADPVGPVPRGARRSILVLGALLLVLLAAQPVPAQEGEGGWDLVETRVNPNDEPTEFVVGVTPDFFESPRFDGTFTRYTISPSSITAAHRWVDREFESYNLTITFSFTPPPQVLTTGERITLESSGRAAGSLADSSNPVAQFEFAVEGADLEGEAYMVVGINPDAAATSGSVSPSFVVPQPGAEDDELVVSAYLWNCASCLVQWVYQPRLTAPPAPTSTSAPTTTATTQPDEPGQCIVRGTVTDAGAGPSSRGRTDRDGHPLAGVRVSLLLPTLEERLVTATDAAGRYEITVIEEDFPAIIDTDVDEFMIRLRLAEAAHDPSRFEVLHKGKTTDLWSKPFLFDCPEGVLDIDFPLGSIPDGYTAVWPKEEFWDDLAEIYHRTHNAGLLADLLRQRIDYGGPLQVCAFCTGAGFTELSTAFWCGATSNGGSCSMDPQRPFIGLGDRTSSLTDGGWPDNREYHEFGHHFLADAFGDAIPQFSGNQNHAGYYVNPTSTDAWTEGFAEFFSMMVTKHIDERVLPHYYRIRGKWWNLEVDRRAWTDTGRFEELALAGLLLDLEDGPDDYQRGRVLPDLRVEWYDLYEDPVHGTLVVGEVINEALSSDISEQTMVAAEFRLGGEVVNTSWGATTPWDLPGGGARGFFAVIVPPGLEWDDVTLAAFEGRPGDMGTDDDPIDLTLQEVWDAIVAHGSEQLEANGHVFDVVDLYDALSEAFGGADADGNGLDDIDQVFIAHGFYADADGDRSYRSETLGRTDHPSRGSFGAMLPRRDVEPPPAALMTVDTGGIHAALAVQISYPEPYRDHTYAYIAEPDEQGRYLVTVPPEGHGASVSLGVLADGYQPVLLPAIDADQFWAEAEASGDVAPSFAVDLIRAAEGSGRGQDPGILIGGGAALLLAAAAWFLVSRRRTISGAENA